MGVRAAVQITLRDRKLSIQNSDEVHFQIVAKTKMIRPRGIRIRLLGVPFPCISNQACLATAGK